MNICREWDGWRYTGGISGDAKMSVTWQVFSLLEARVVYETTTEGYAQHEEGTLEGDYLLIADAFAAAAANLAADRRFHDVLVAGAAPVSAANTPAPIAIPVAPRFAGGVEGNILRIDRAVVTVLLGNGHASAFFVTPTLLLTNHHVAGNRAQVRIRLSDGSEAIGRLLRSDAARDIALVEIDTPLAAALPLRTSLPARAEVVYAVGSPDDTGLAGTITRGIVSQIRTDERGLDWIQADVTIHPGSSGGPLLDANGNVIGIAAARPRGSISSCR
jgi:S1-C subfamily serine protease